jgi:hypothetical protein
MKHVEQADGYILQDRRGQNHDPEPAGERASAEILIHKFVSCSVCGTQHLVIGDQKFDPLRDCPRSVASGWQWTMGYGPGYGPYGRDDARRQLSPEDQLRRAYNLEQLGKLIGA